MISCILLSAGLSSRFGSPKALAKINQKTIVEHIQTTLIEASVGEIVVVLGAQADQIKPFILKHKRIKFVYNKDYNFGQTSSFKIGLENISKKSLGVMLLPVDYPLVKVETIQRLSDFFLNEMPTILLPVFNNKKGHPPIFHSKLTKEFLALDNSLGINTIIHEHPETILLPVQDSGVTKTFNTPEEFEKVKEEMGNF